MTVAGSVLTISGILLLAAGSVFISVTDDNIPLGAALLAVGGVSFSSGIVLLALGLRRIRRSRGANSREFRLAALCPTRFSNNSGGFTLGLPGAF